VCVLLDCPGETGVDDELKSATPLASSHRTRIIWHSNIATHSASNGAAGPVHRGSSGHRDVTQSQSKAALSQQEAVSGQQETLGALDQSSGGSPGVAEHFKPQVHSNTSVRRSDNRSVNASCTGALKQSCVGVELADSEDSSFSRSRSKAEPSKCSVNERHTSDAIPSRHSFSNDSNTDAQTRVKSDKLSDVSRSEWNSVSNARASVNGCYQSQTLSGRQVSVDSDYCEVADSSRKQHCEVSGKQQQSTDSGRKQQQSADNVTKHCKVADSGRKQQQSADNVTKHCKVADSGRKQQQSAEHCKVADSGRKQQQSADNVTKHCKVADSGRKQQLSHDTDDSLQLFDDKDGGVNKPERLHGWSDGVSKPDRLHGWSDGVSKPDRLHGWSGGGSKPGKFHGSSSGTSSRGKLRL